MDNEVDSFINSMIDCTKEPLTDILEIGIDEILDFNKYPMIKELPIIKIFLSGAQILLSVRDKHLIKKILIFREEFNNGDKIVDREKFIAYKSTIENNDNICKKDAEKLLIYLDRFQEEKKSIMLAKIYKSYINRIIDRREFLEFAGIVDRLLERDIIVLKKIYLKEEKNISREESFIAERLHSYGLIGIGSSFSYSGYSDYQDGMTRTLSVIGKKFCECVF